MEHSAKSHCGGIRIRHSDKRITRLPDNAIFVELVANDDKIIAVVSRSKDNSFYTIFDSTDKSACERYCKFFGVNFVGKVVDFPSEKFIKIG